MFPPHQVNLHNILCSSICLNIINLQSGSRVDMILIFAWCWNERYDKSVRMGVSGTGTKNVCWDEDIECWENMTMQFYIDVFSDQKLSLKIHEIETLNHADFFRRKIKEQIYKSTFNLSVIQLLKHPNIIKIHLWQSLTLIQYKLVCYICNKSLISLGNLNVTNYYQLCLH